MKMNHSSRALLAVCFATAAAVTLPAQTRITYAKAVFVKRGGSIPEWTTDYNVLRCSVAIEHDQ